MRLIIIILCLIIDLSGIFPLYLYISSFFKFLFFIFLYLIINLFSTRWLINFFSVKVSCVNKIIWILIKENIQSSGVFGFFVLLFDLIIDSYIAAMLFNIFLFPFILLFFFINKIILSLLLL